MPSRSRSEHAAMQAAAHDKKLADKIGIPQDVAREFVEADQHNSKWKKRDHVAKKAAEAAMTPEMYLLMKKAGMP